jgi:peptide/nickel transport system substrate-binding protein
VVTTSSPAERFVFVRNPYYHRVDPNGHQLPYLDRVIVQVADGKIIPAKTGAGEADLQARYLHFDNYTFLKAAEARNNYHVRLWRNGYGAQWALYPNLNANDPVWRALFRDVRFRRALSLGIDRDEINQVIYYGLAIPSNDTLLPESPLFRPEYQSKWANFDIKQANALLDAIGLTERDGGIRLLPDGRPLQIIVETASEGNEAVDVLELIASNWRKLGIKLLTKPMQLDNLRNRIFAGDTLMTIALGLDNGLATAAMSPAELAPTDQTTYQWPKWGQYHQTGGQAGEAPDMPEAIQLMDLLHQWENATTSEEQAAAWREMLAINADQVFNIGLVQGVPQPVVVRNTLRNVPNEAMYSWDPGAHFGMYRADSFWLDTGG